MARRIKSLSYEVVPLSTVSTVADDAPPLEVMLNGFRCRVDAHRLTAEPDADYDDAAVAQSVLQSALEAWSATSELIDRTPISFKLQGYSSEEVPVGDGPATSAHAIMESVILTDVVAVAKHAFPEPRADIGTEGPVSALLRRRWRRVVRGQESPVIVGYLVLTTVEHYFGPGAPKKLNISSKVWAELSKICSTDDPEYGRKGGGWVTGGLSEAHLNWIRQLCPIVIRRVLEYEAGVEILDRLTKAHLPPLS